MTDGTQDSRHRYTARDLWGDDGRPGANDVQQKGIGDCFLVAAAGAVAQQTPDIIRNGIDFDEKSGNLSVRLFKQGQWHQVEVTQVELRDNLAVQGASSFQSSSPSRPDPRHPDAGHGLWPAVYEVGYAKLEWGSWKSGQRMLRQGGNPADALQAITGEAPVSLTAKDVSEMGAERAAERINAELANGKRIVMGTNTDPWQRVKSAGDVRGWFYGINDRLARPGTTTDGVDGNHAYMVMGARYDKAANEAYLTLRNPWGHNQVHDKVSGKHAAEWTNKPDIEVKLDDLLRDDTRSLNKFDIGMLQPQQRELFEAIRGHVREQASEDAIALAAVQASRGGIESARQLRTAMVADDGKLWVVGQTPGFRTMVDTQAPMPNREESLGNLALEAQRLQPMAQQPDAPARQLS